ncbi:MAG: hypothetical protein SVM80_11715 [Halobacteriota archaeon]|nr:hypothetical protein [Halobacteriota archaeon]
MKKNDIVRRHCENAVEYDRQILEYRWFGSEALFGMIFEYVKPDNRLLGIGIGTEPRSLNELKILVWSGYEKSSDQLPVSITPPYL